jgi:hypothetical protein
MLRSVMDGIRRVNRAPAILAGVWAATMLVSLPLAAALRADLTDHLGASLAAHTAANGVNYDWMQEFSDQAAGAGVTFRPTIIGFGASLDNLSAFMDNTRRPLIVVFTASAYIGIWLFLAGGIIDRYARQRPTRAYGFFSACGVFFFRFLRLGVVQWAIYVTLFGTVHSWLLDRLEARLTHEIAVERTAFLIRAGLYVIFGVLLAAAMTLFDYAKVRAVVEDRRSALGSIAAAIGFIRRNAGATIGLFVSNFVLFLVVIGAYALAAPGAGGGGISVWIGFAIGQLYIVARLWVKLVFWASETALFQSRLAHAGYVARPEPVWPDSPEVEALSS